MRVLKWFLREALGTAIMALVIYELLPYVVAPSWQVAAIYFVIGATFVLLVSSFPPRRPGEMIPWWGALLVIVIWPYALMEFTFRVIKVVRNRS